MKALFFITLVLFYTLNVLSQDKGTKVVHISTHGWFIPDSSAADTSIRTLPGYKEESDTTLGILTAYEAVNPDTALIVLSLADMDSSITKNWDAFIQNYQKKNYLIAVSTKDDLSKMNFILYFYRKRNEGNSIRKAYELAAENFKNTYPELKHFLYLTK